MALKNSNEIGIWSAWRTEEEIIEAAKHFGLFFKGKSYSETMPVDLMVFGYLDEKDKNAFLELFWDKMEKI